MKNEVPYSTNSKQNLIQGFKRCESPAASLKQNKRISFNDSLQAFQGIF